MKNCIKLQKFWKVWEVWNFLPHALMETMNPFYSTSHGSFCCRPKHVVSCMLIQICSAKGMQNMSEKGSALSLQQSPDKMEQEIMGKWGAVLLNFLVAENAFRKTLKAEKKKSLFKRVVFIRKQRICIRLYTEHSFIIYYRSEFFCLKEKMARPKRSPFQQKPSFFVFSPHSSFFLSLSFSFSAQLPWKWTINLFPKGIPYATQAWQPQYDGCYVVNKQFSWASLPFKGTFSSGADHVKNVVVKGFSAFIPTQRCQMERVRISKHVNPHERKLGPLFPPRCLRVHSACKKFPVLEQDKCAFELGCNMAPFFFFFLREYRIYGVS